MINIDKFKTFITTVANKNSRGNLTPEQFNSITERALFAWTNNQIANQKQYQPGNPISQTSFELDAISMAKLTHLKETRDVRVVNGLMGLPNGTNIDVNSLVMPTMWFPSRILHKYTSNGKIVSQPIDIVKDSEWVLRLNSNIVAPTKKRAIANYQNNHLLIEPSNLINLVTLTYVRNPLTPIWFYTVVNGRPVYDSINSVDVDAPESAMNEIAMIALELIGIRIREQELVQSAASMENKGV